MQRKKQPSKNPVLEVLEKARAIDRRRQAQIHNQAESITRLLAQINEHSCMPLDLMTGHPLTSKPMLGYSEEMRMLHEGFADLQVRYEDAVTTLAQLVAAVDGLPDGRACGDKEAGIRLAEILSSARELVPGREKEKA